MRPIQIHAKLLILTWVVSCLGTEKRPFYESLYDPENIFHVEDYHADLVLGMLPEIKSSIKDFRKRNYTNNDIENMYQTLTIFWPVIRKYLHLKDELVDSVSSESNGNYTQLSSNEIGQSQLSQASSFPYKNDQLISPQIKPDSMSTSNNQNPIANTRSPISELSKNKSNSPSAQQNSNRRNFGTKIKRVRPSLPLNDDKRNIQIMYPNRNIQSKTTISQSSTTTRRPFKPTSNKPNRNIQSKTTISQSTTTTRIPFKPTSNKPLSPTTTRPFKLISLKHLSNTDDRPSKSISNKHSVSTTRRPFKHTIQTPISITDDKPSKPISNKHLVSTTRRPFKHTSQIPLSITYDRPFKHTTSRLLRPTNQKNVPDNGSNPARTASKSIPTTISRPIPASSTSGALRRTTSRSNPSAVKDSDARNPPKHDTKQVDLSGESNSPQNNEATNKSPAAESVTTAINDAVSYYRGFSNILKVIGNPIDVSDLNG